MESKELVEIVGEAIKTEFKEFWELSQKQAGEIAELKTAIEKLQLGSKKSSPELNSLKAQAIVVDIFRKAYKTWVNTEENFKALADAEIKAAFVNEGIATEGAELVFDQFEANIINVMKEYALVNEVKIYSTRGKNLKIPRVTNGITTVWTWEGVGYTGSKLASAFVTINVFKATSFVTYSDEVMEDNMTIPELYQMIVRLIWESQGAFVEDAILNGNGTQVDGVFNNANVKVVTAVATKTKLSLNTWEQLDDLLNDLDTAVSMEYQKNTENLVAVMSQYTFNVLRKAKNSTTGFYMFPELRQANPTLLGKYRVIKSHKAPVQTAAADIASATPIIIWDFKNYYGLVRRKGLTMTRGYASWDFEEGLETIRAEQRFWGVPTIPEAFAKLKNAAA